MLMKGVRGKVREERIWQRGMPELFERVVRRIQVNGECADRTREVFGTVPMAEHWGEGGSRDGVEVVEGQEF